MEILKDVSSRRTNKLTILSLRNINNSNKKYPIADGSFIQDDMVEKWNDSKWLYDQMERGNVIADELYTKYYSKYPNAFHGWYWIYEVDNLNFKTKDDFYVLGKAIDINLKDLKGKNHLPLNYFLK